jgi:hypothetical protein
MRSHSCKDPEKYGQSPPFWVFIGQSPPKDH